MTAYVPRTGTCVAVEQMEILRISVGGGFEPVWRGTTYEASGPEAEIADITFVDLADDSDQAIRRSARRVRCGDDDCFCREGPVVSDVIELFKWDHVAGQFRPAR